MQIIFRMAEAVSRIKSNEVANVAMSSSAARSADRGGAAGGGVRKLFRVESLGLSCT